MSDNQIKLEGAFDKTHEEIRALLLQRQDVTYYLENKCGVAISYKHSHYYGFTPGDEVVVVGLEYTHNYLEEGKDTWMPLATERYHPNNIDDAIESFIARTSPDAWYKKHAKGQTYEEIFGPKIV